MGGDEIYKVSEKGLAFGRGTEKGFKKEDYGEKGLPSAFIQKKKSSWPGRLVVFEGEIDSEGFSEGGVKALIWDYRGGNERKGLN